MTRSNPGTPAPAVVRAAEVLNAISRRLDAPLRISDIADETGIPNSSVTNILAALVETRFVRRIGHGYSIGPAAVEIASAFLRSDDTVQRFREFVPSMEHLSAETTQLATLTENEVLFLARHEGVQPITLTSAIGKRLPASSTAVGKAMLAQLENAQLDSMLTEPLTQLTPRSHRTLKSLVSDLAEVRTRGYAIDDEEAASNVICLSVAVEVPDGQSRYAISTTLFKERLTTEFRERLVADLASVASHLSN